MKNVLPIFAPPRYLTILAVLFFVATSADYLFAQATFTTEYQPSQVQMTSAESACYTALQDAAISKSVKIVSTSDIRISQPNDTIFFLLPGQSDTTWAEASLISDDSISGFQWSGRLLNKLGYISLLYRNGLTAGYIQVESDFYELMP
jgi:hypothetical protein